MNEITLPVIFMTGIVAYAVLSWVTRAAPRVPRTTGPARAAILAVITLTMIFGFYVSGRAFGNQLAGLPNVDVFSGLLHWIAFSAGIGMAYFVDESSRKAVP